MLVRGDISQEPARNDWPFPKLKGWLGWIIVDVTSFWFLSAKAIQAAQGTEEQKCSVNADFWLKPWGGGEEMGSVIRFNQPLT